MIKTNQPPRFPGQFTGLNSAGVHLRSGIFYNGAEKDLPKKVDWESAWSNLKPCLEDYDLIYLACDSNDLKKAAAEYLSN